METRIKEILTQSVRDSLQDVEILSYLSGDLVRKLTKNILRLKHISKHIHPVSYATSLTLMQDVLSKTSDLNKQIRTLRRQKITPTKQALITRSNRTSAVYEKLRTFTHAAGGVITSCDWQSPSYESSGYSQAGRLSGTIKATYNDYKRDQHEDAFSYEQKFLKEYIQTPLSLPIHICATHSGMAAFTTIITFLSCEGHLNDHVLVGQSSYFECKHILRTLLGDTYHEVDESDPKSIERAMKKFNPSVVFLDTIANDQYMFAPNIPGVISSIKKHAKRDVYLVIDNTMTSMYIQPFGSIMYPGCKVKLIMYESLNKFHQFGLDTVFGGILYGWGADTAKLFDYRVHAGTNISDSAVLTLPTPDKRILMHHMKRIERNTRLLSDIVSDYIHSSCPSFLERVVYPGINDHPSHDYTKTYPGAFFTLLLAPRFRTIRKYKRIVEAIMKQAKHDHIRIVAGTSFGLTSTRVYLTAVRTTDTTPFIRISPGTENLLCVYKVAQTLIKAFNTLT